MKITGENNPISGGLNNYKVEWSENLSYEVTLHFSTLKNTGVFVMPNITADKVREPLCSKPRDKEL